jgi:hypothetical protein
MAHDEPPLPAGVEIGRLPGGSKRMFVCPTIEEPADKSVCLYCGSSLKGRRAREHIFEQWLLRHFDMIDEPFQVTWVAPDKEEERDTRQMPLKQFVAGRVCETCNPLGVWRKTADSLTIFATPPDAPTRSRRRRDGTTLV